METKILNKTKETISIEFSGDIGCGVITFNYNNNGGYIVNAEYISIENLFDIIKNTNLEDFKEDEGV